MLRFWQNRTKCYIAGGSVRQQFHFFVEHAYNHVGSKCSINHYCQTGFHKFCSAHIWKLDNTSKIKCIHSGPFETCMSPTLELSGDNSIKVDNQSLSETNESSEHIRGSGDDSVHDKCSHIGKNLLTAHYSESDGGVIQSLVEDHSLASSCSVKDKESVHPKRLGKDLSNYLDDSLCHMTSDAGDSLPTVSPSEVDISELRPVVPARAYDLAAYVNQSETLSSFVKLGVNLAEIQKDKKMASFLARLDFKQDVQPYLLFLLNSGVKGVDVSRLITKNPAVFKERMDDLEVKVNYLESKKFSKDAIGRMFAKAPLLLSLTTVDIDRRLGYLQKEFHLTGNEVRAVVTSHPMITIWETNRINEKILAFGEFMGFTDQEKKQILLAAPKLFLMRKDQLIEKFNYLHNTMGFSHADLLVWPDIFRTRLHIIKQRHQFLKLLGRDQFHPTRENFVSLKALVGSSEKKFCEKIAKCDISVYHDFLKTI